MSRLSSILLIACAVAFVGCATVQPPVPYGPCPTPQQVQWQRMETNMFCHFGPNTFTGAEWGNGAEPEDLFNPTALNCDQWVAVAKAAGFAGIIITAKHHDGFCLWPNPESRHTVRESSWRNGQGDVLCELSDACRRGGIGFGIYISPWDRNAPTYGSPQYNTTFCNTLIDALTRYGAIFEQWFDGANGEGPDGRKQQYDWPLFNSTVATLQPQALVFSDVGPGCRWVGNEQGRSGTTCWSRLDTQGYAPGAEAPKPDVLNAGQRDGSRWIPAECDVSIRPGWFYHPEESPKSLQQLLEIYYSSVGRNGLLLLNVPPDRRGLIPAADSARLVEFRTALDSIFRHDVAQTARVSASNTRGMSCHYRPAQGLDTAYHTYWTADDSCLSPTLTLRFAQPVTFNRVMLQEYIPLGQRVEQFSVQTYDGHGWNDLAQGTTIGYKRILLTPQVTTSAIRILFRHTLAVPAINRVALYQDNVYRFE